MTTLRRDVKLGRREEQHHDDVLLDQRPLTRAGCVGGERPCPFVSCRWHLFLDMTDAGTLKLNFPDLEVWEMEESCVLDVADRGGSTLEEVGTVLNITRERVRQIETRAGINVQRALLQLGVSGVTR